MGAKKQLRAARSYSGTGGTSPARSSSPAGRQIAVIASVASRPAGRAGLVLTTVLFLAVAGIGAYAGASTGTGSSRPAPAPPCAPDQVRAVIAGYRVNAFSSTGYTYGGRKVAAMLMFLQNKTAAACEIAGYPDVKFLSAAEGGNVESHPVGNSKGYGPSLPVHFRDGLFWYPRASFHPLLVLKRGSPASFAIFYPYGSPSQENHGGTGIPAVSQLSGIPAGCEKAAALSITIPEPYTPPTQPPPTPPLSPVDLPEGEADHWTPCPEVAAVTALQAGTDAAGAWPPTAFLTETPPPLPPQPPLSPQDLAPVPIPVSTTPYWIDSGILQIAPGPGIQMPAAFFLPQLNQWAGVVGRLWLTVTAGAQPDNPANTERSGSTATLYITYDVGGIDYAYDRINLSAVTSSGEVGQAFYDNTEIHNPVRIVSVTGVYMHVEAVAGQFAPNAAGEDVFVGTPTGAMYTFDLQTLTWQ